MQPIQVFSKEWFELHQDKLLKFANSWVGRRVFRLKSNLPKGEKLVRITPESSHYHKDGDEYVAVSDFQTYVVEPALLGLADS